MLEIPPTLDIAAPQIVLVAEGDSPSAQANARGHLFEKFVARLFAAFGCDPPNQSCVNVKQNGYEVDVTTQMTLTRERAIAECKAYSSPLPSNSLSAFYGKLCAERLESPGTHGWFVAIPGLTSDGHQLARKLEQGDTRFRLVTATQIYELVKSKGWIEPVEPKLGIVMSDHALLISKQGLCSIAKQLDSTTRLPTRVLVHRPSGPLTQTEQKLLASTDYAAGLEISNLAEAASTQMGQHVKDFPTLVSVVGSKGDFEYQFPAAPAFFIGREALLSNVDEVGEEALLRGTVIVLNAQSGWGKSSLALRIAHQIEIAGGFATVFDTRTAASSTYVAAALRKAMTDAELRGILTLPLS